VWDGAAHETITRMKLHPLKRKRVIWTRTTDAKLGTMPDSALARKLRITIGTVLKRRQKLGIAASRPAKSIRWTREMISMLGRIPDGRFAETYGMNILTVSTKRRDLGIRCFARRSKTWHHWTKKEIAMLGRMPDAVVAEKTGIKKPSVAWKRGKLGIPPFSQRRPKKQLTDWTRREIAVLGRMTDAAAAETLDLALTAVRKKRISLGIPPFGRSARG
jgi:hypothetical protein